MGYKDGGSTLALGLISSTRRTRTAWRLCVWREVAAIGWCRVSSSNTPGYLRRYLRRAGPGQWSGAVSDTGQTASQSSQINQWRWLPVIGQRAGNDHLWLNGRRKGLGRIQNAGCNGRDRRCPDTPAHLSSDPDWTSSDRRILPTRLPRHSQDTTRRDRASKLSSFRFLVYFFFHSTGQAGSRVGCTQRLGKTMVKPLRRLTAASPHCFI